MDAEETWLPIPGTTYQASTFGRIRSSRKILKYRLDHNGYARVYICNGSLSGQKECYVARLVCLAFYGSPPNPKDEVDHINMIPLDNRPSNLRWLTLAENRARRRIVRGASHHLARLTEGQVRAIKLKSTCFQTDKQLADAMNVSRETIRDVRLGKVWKHVV